MTERRGRVERLRDWLFRDRQSGRIVVAQPPNLALVAFAATAAPAWLMARALPGSFPSLVAALRVAAALSLVWWSSDEILRGVNPWRRCLGAAVLLGTLWAALWAAWSSV